MQPSPFDRRVGIRIGTFEAFSGFTHVTAHRIAQSPKATFVTRLQPFRLPGRAARQLPDQSTTLRVESSSTGDSRLRGARSNFCLSSPFNDALGFNGIVICVSYDLIVDGWVEERLINTKLGNDRRNVTASGWRLRRSKCRAAHPSIGAT